MSGMPIPVEGRLWGKVQKTESCWIWQGHVTKKETGKNHGQIRFKGRLHLVHRVSWELHNGPIPLGMNVLHRCDNPPCVRPDHLFLGTVADNNRDAAIKGRIHRPRGIANAHAKLNDDIARRILEMTNEGLKPAEIGKLLGIHKGTVRGVSTRQRWKHVTLAGKEGNRG